MLIVVSIYYFFKITRQSSGFYKNFSLIKLSKNLLVRLLLKKLELLFMVKQLKDYKRLVNFIKENDCFQISGNTLFCNSCNEPKEYNSQEGIRGLKRHLQSKKHLEALNRKKNQKRLDVIKTGVEIENFHYSLINSFIVANIPLQKLANIELKKFLKNISGNKIKTPASYRTSTLNDIFDKKRRMFKNTLRVAPIFL